VDPGFTSWTPGSHREARVAFCNKLNAAGPVRFSRIKVIAP
jgi:hypothetical protein